MGFAHCESRHRSSAWRAYRRGTIDEGQQCVSVKLRDRWSIYATRVLAILKGIAHSDPNGGCSLVRLEMVGRVRSDTAARKPLMRRLPGSTSDVAQTGRAD